VEIKENYQTVAHSMQQENTIKKSHFIALIQEVEQEQEARSFVKSVVQQFPDATHYCWAYRLGFGNKELIKYSDNGEPPNSAGPPILQAIKQEQVTNVLVVVVRYFGGVKLGMSGLIKAYRDTARKGLQKAGKKSKYPLQEFFIEEIEYQSLGTILQSIESKAGKIKDIEYGEKVKILVLLPEREKEWVRQLINNTTQGKAILKSGATRWLSA
jgi:uncharacterized YigZ family protein